MRTSIRSELSGGMRQRVAIARTLILSPRIILMDEPFGALDPATRLHMQELLVSLWREAQATVFFVTHSIEEAVYLGDRVYVFSSSPGTILREIEVPPPDRPPKEMQREKRVRRARLRDPRYDRHARRRRRAAATDVHAQLHDPRPIGRRTPQQGAGLTDYLKEAFFFRWNLLLLPGRGGRRGADAACPTVLLPLVAAGELTYLAGLISIPRFRAAIDAKVHAARGDAPQLAAPRAAPSLVAMLAGLPAEARRRFERLHARCVEMRRDRRRRSRRRRDARADPRRRSGRPASIGCCGSFFGCSCRRPRSIGSWRR